MLLWELKIHPPPVCHDVGKPCNKACFQQREEKPEKTLKGHSLG